MEHADIKPGNTVIVIGGGSIGLLMVQLVKNSGASEIILIEPDEYKQKLGIELGADYALSPTGEQKEIKVLADLQADVVIECVGNKDTVINAVKMAGKGGKVIIFGLAPKDQNITLNLQYLFQKELKIFNSYLNPFTIKPAIDLLVNKKIEVKKLITKKIFLKNISGIFSDTFTSGSIKVQIINN
jgi:threonine dehydrogenase-like Zn-dependent dehydrogenase